MKKTIIHALNSALHLTILLALVIGLGNPLSVSAKNPPFTRIIVFGDSLSDTGNLSGMTGGTVPVYGTGRYCNGPLWVEYLAQDLGMLLTPGDDYAVGGATTGTENFNDGVLGRGYPGLLDQVATYQTAPLPQPVASDALFVVWAGSNDFLFDLPPSQLIGNGVTHTLQAVQGLWATGARHILVANVPDLGLTPMALASPIAPQLTQLAAAYNQALAQGLQLLDAAGVRTISFDSFGLLQAIVANPSDYGFANVNTPAVMLGSGVDQSQFVFWDPFHPTTRSHEVIAEQALSVIMDAFLTDNGQADPDGQVHALRGRVHANHGR